MTSAVVADQLQASFRTVVDAECRPGMQASQIEDVVHRVMDGYPRWRIRAIRQGKAGCFSAAAYHRWMELFRAWEERRAARMAASAEVERARQRRLTRDTLERSRAEAVAALARIEQQLARLADHGGGPA